MNESPHDQPYGTYRLSSGREWLRRQAAYLPDGRIGRMGASVMRRAIIGSGTAPVDVEVFPSIKARLYPATNRCEKRAVLAVQFFDRRERDFIAERVASAVRQPVIVVDLGANVGLYGLSALAAGRDAGKEVKVLAVEPDGETRRRLEQNIAFSAAQSVFSVAPVGVGARRSSAILVGHATNRGQHKILEGGAEAAGDQDSGMQIEVHPLLDICDGAGIDRIDVLKIDVEGFDFEVVSAFLETAPQTLWPDAIIVEVGRAPAEAPVMKLLGDHGYVLAERTKLNAIMVAQPITRR